MTLTRRNLYRSFPLFLLTLAATTAQAADSYLKVIPSTALAWGAVNHINEASDKIKNLATIVQAPAVSVLEEIKKESGLQKGIDEKGAAGFFVVPGKTEKEDACATPLALGATLADVVPGKTEKEDPCVAAVFVAVADEKEFLSNFEVVKAGEKISEVKLKTASKQTHYLAMRNGYALISPKKDLSAVEAAVEAKQSIAAEMAGLESWLAENDGSVVGTAAGIKFAAKLARVELKKAKDSVGSGAEAAILRPMLEMYGKVLEVAPSELSLATAGIRCDKQGSIRIIGRARLVNGGMVSKAVAGIPPVTENLLAGVPGGPFAFAAGGVGLPNLIDGYKNLAIGLMKSMKSVYGMSAEDLERLSKESFEGLRQVRSMSIVMKTGKRGDPIYSNIFCAMHVDNSQRLLGLQEKYMESANKLMQNAKQGILKSMTVKRLEIAGKPALQQEVNLDLSSMAVPEESRAVLDEMMGIGGKMLLYHVAADEHTVLIGVGISQERMAAALDVVKQPKKSLAEDADISVTAAMLQANAQWVAYMSPRGYMQLVQRMMTATLKNIPEAGRFSLPQFPKCPPVGFAVLAAPTELYAEIAVPSSLIQATGEYVKEMQNMFMQRMMEQNQPPAP